MTSTTTPRTPDLTPTTSTPPRDPAKRIDAHGVPGRVPWIAVGVYLAIAFIGGWLACLPLWTSGKELAELMSTPTFAISGTLMMWSPALAAVVAVFAVQRPDKPWRELGFLIRPFWRTLGFCALAWTVPVLFNLIGALGVGALGGFTFGSGTLLDLFTKAGVTGIPESKLVWIAVLQTVLVAVPLGTSTALGEEIGWRGFLVQALAPLGKWTCALVTGVIWGIWHAPLLLLGYNFHDRGIGGILLMVLFCIPVGACFMWLRMRSETVWPAAIAHGSMNASVTLGLILWANEPSVLTNLTIASMWPMWVCYAITALIALTVWGSRPKPRPWRLDSAEDANAELKPVVTPARPGYELVEEPREDC